MTIPTAHVMPSTLGASPSKLCPAGEQGCSQGSAKPAVPGSAPGLARNGDLNAGKSSQVPPRDLLRLYRAAGENGCEHSWPPAAEHTRAEDTWKFDTPAMEQTLNQSLFVDSVCTDPLHRCQKFTLSSEAGKDHYKVLPESKQAPGANGACEPRDGTWPSGSRLMPPAGLQANNFYPKPVAAPPGRVWLQESCTLHPHQGVCELSAWKQQLDKVRLQVEQMQVGSCDCVNLKRFLVSSVRNCCPRLRSQEENVSCFSLSDTQSLLMVCFYSLWCHRYRLTRCVCRAALDYVTGLHHLPDQELKYPV